MAGHVVAMLVPMGDPRDLDGDRKDTGPNGRSLQQQLSSEHLRFANRVQLSGRLITAISVVFAILASALPILALFSGIRSIGNKNTTVHGDLALSISLALAMILLGGTYVRSHGQRREIYRLRRYLYDLEKRLRQASSSALSDALDGLSSTSILTRIGAIHLLGRLASDSTNNSVAIQAVLSAFVREYHWDSDTRMNLGRDDLLAAITVLGQAVFIPKDDGDRLRLSKVDLHGLDMSNLTFLGVDFSGANLDECTLSSTILDGSTFTGASLRGANLFRASLKGVILEDASLDSVSAGGADFSLSLMTHCSVRSAFLVQANFRESFLADADFSDSNLSGANFSGAFLRGMSLVGADLTGVSFPDDSDQENTIGGLAKGIDQHRPVD